MKNIFLILSILFIGLVSCSKNEGTKVDGISISLDGSDTVSVVTDSMVKVAGVVKSDNANLTSVEFIWNTTTGIDESQGQKITTFTNPKRCTFSTSYTPGTAMPTGLKIVAVNADNERVERQVVILNDSLSVGSGDGLAFPGAEGAGYKTTGGRGGKVIYVTSLSDDNVQGSLRWAINQGGARIIMFKVSGTIVLTSELKISNGNVTIAGQTAPGDGICLRGYPMTIAANNVIIRFMRFRLGNDNVARIEADAIEGRGQNNIILDHCSMSWSIDECASFYNNSNFTMQWCLVSESLNNAGHEKGPHGYGGIWGGHTATFHHNLLAHHVSRNPRFNGARLVGANKSLELVEFVNNVVYNWGDNSTYGGEDGRINMINNYYKPGPASSNGKRILQAYRSMDGSRVCDYGVFYVEGNVMEGNSTITANNWASGGVEMKRESGVSVGDRNQLSDIKSDAPFEVSTLSPQTAQVAYGKVLDYVGASLSRDAVDVRVVSEVRNGIASYGYSGIIDSPTDVGGYPTLNQTAAALDTDGDGMPDEWEDANGLNKNDARDGRLYTLDKAYTNVEVYINSLVEHITSSQK